MATEKAPEETGAAVAAAPQPAPAPLQVDQEKVRIAEELRQAKAALGEVGEMVRSGKLKLTDPVQPEQEDETALVDRKELKKIASGLQQQVGQALLQTQAMNASRMRDAQIELMRGKLKDFDKLEGDIRGLLEKVDPNVAANPDTIKQVHRIVRADYLEKKEAEEELARQNATAEGDDEVWGDTGEEAESELRPGAGRAQSAKPAARPQGGVAPSGDASASRPQLRTQNQRVAPLSAEERTMAERFGITSAAEYRQYADPNWQFDSQGAKGRKRF